MRDRANPGSAQQEPLGIDVPETLLAIADEVIE
jgi:hypothetical protein